MRRIASSVILALAFGLLAAVFAYPSSASDTPSGALAQSASPDQASDDSALLQIIQTDMARAGSGHFGVAVKHLPTGRTVYWNADRVYQSASLYKLMVLYEAYRQQRAGLISFNDKMLVTQAIADVNGGYSPVPVGSYLAVSRALELMITVSDNVSAVSLRQKLGVGSINTSIRQRLGLTETSLAYDSQTSPRDMARFFDGLGRLAYIDVDASKEMMHLLLNQKNNDRIPQNLPSWVWVAHKTGELPGVRNDAGIIYSPVGPIILAMVTDSAANVESVRRAEATLAADVYKYATDGRFGTATSAPFLYDPELEARLKPVLAAAGGKISLAIQHVNTGQGTLVRPTTAWPLDSGFDPDGLVDPRAVKARRVEPRAACQGDPECLAALAEPVSADDFESRVGRGDLNEGVTLRLALARAQKAGGIVAKMPDEDVVAYLDSRDGGTIREVAVVRGSSGLYVVASSAPASTVTQLQTAGSTISSYLAACVWGARAQPKACSAE